MTKVLCSVPGRSTIKSKNKDSHCAQKKDVLNDWLNEMRAADGIRAQERNNSTTSFVLAPVYGVTSTGTYPDMHRWMCLVDEPKSGAIWWNYFFPAPLSLDRRSTSRRSAASHTLNAWLNIAEMVVVGSSYWNMGFGREKGETLQDDYITYINNYNKS